VLQPLSVYYYLEPDAVYASLFAYSGGIPWAESPCPCIQARDGQPDVTAGELARRSIDAGRAVKNRVSARDI